MEPVHEHLNQLTHRMIGLAMEVHRHLGQGLLESVYQRCMEYEVRSQGVECEPQAKLPVMYKGRALDCELVMDFFFPGCLVVELKAVERLHPIHEAQLLTYMRLSNAPIGLLINFNVPVLKDGIKRMAL